MLSVFMSGLRGRDGLLIVITASFLDAGYHDFFLIGGRSKNHENVRRNTLTFFTFDDKGDVPSVFRNTTRLMKVERGTEVEWSEG